MEWTNRIKDLQDDSVSSHWTVPDPSDSALLSLVDNFQRQFGFLYPERETLFIVPLNEDGHRRFVSSTVCPSRPSVPQLVSWSGCSSFVAHFVIHEDQLEEPPFSLSSPPEVLRRRRASCWESSVLLLSLLLGAGYDAHCVSGYTQQEPGPGSNWAPLRLRRSCWVLVVSGCRSVSESFFIDPQSGERFSTHSQRFSAIQSVWNQRNYYVNMQDCRGRCAFDLEDLRFWEPVLPTESSRQQQHQQTGFVLRTWVTNFTVTDKHLVLGPPEGQGLSDDGTRLQKDQLMTRETAHTHTQLKEVDSAHGWTAKPLTTQTPFNLLCYRWRLVGGGLERWAEFGSAREDQLISRVMSEDEMTERFEGRSDRLYLRHTVFIHTHQHSPVQRVVECFHRNQSKPLDQDIDQRLYLVPEGRVHLTFHSQRLVQSQTTFFKPLEITSQDRGRTSCFLINLEAPPPQPVSLCRIRKLLIHDKETTLRQIRQSQQEMSEIVSRFHEEENVELINTTTAEQTHTGEGAAALVGEEPPEHQ